MPVSATPLADSLLVCSHNKSLLELELGQCGVQELPSTPPPLYVVLLLIGLQETRIEGCQEWERTQRTLGWTPPSPAQLGHCSIQCSVCRVPHCLEVQVQVCLHCSETLDHTADVATLT
jgi:hypothetical protein